MKRIRRRDGRIVIADNYILQDGEAIDEGSLL
jgi:hypothetical protein